jgi:hypothetical protein
MQADGIRHSALTGKQIKKSGSSGWFQLCYKKCNYGWLLLTADLKYHQFYEAENQLLSRYCILKANVIQNYIVDYLRKILNFAIILSEENTNPVTYRIWRMKELSVEDKLRAIYDLQLIDSRIEIRNVEVNFLLKWKIWKMKLQV